LADRSTGDDIERLNGVCVCVGGATGVGVGLAVAVGLGVEVGVGHGVDVGVGDDDRVCVGEGNGVGNSDSVGDGDGCSTIGSSVGWVSAALMDSSLDAGAGVALAVDPGSDQSPTFSPLAKVVCNRV
jgi:hypothetical protein